MSLINSERGTFVALEYSDLARLEHLRTGLILPVRRKICISETSSNNTENSGNETTAHTMTHEDVTNETVGFMSENSGYGNTMSTMNTAESRADKLNSFEFAQFLTRPVKIHSFTWNETDLVSVLNTVEPWYAFFNDARIKNKLHNFAFLQCDLKIKILINASPFYYGAMMASYQPLHNFTANTIPTTSSTEFLVPYSQRPHVWIYPQANQGAEMTLPFFLQRNWIKTSFQQDFKDMGKLSFIPYTQLQSANGTTGVGVTVSVFAWAENIEVSGPTVGLALAQAGDEYTGMISQPSSLVANIASRLSSVPVIGKFALATQVGAGAIAKIAHMFGFTNTPVLSDTLPIKPRPLHNFADSSIGFPIDKLTVDPKNELGISSDIVGCQESDPLVISTFIAKESYLTTATWSTLAAPDTILFSAAVAPSLCDTETGPPIKIFGTPMSHCAALFDNWRGDIIFRFHIIASQFHKGRIRIQWDPAGSAAQNVINDVNAYSGCFNQIVDLGKDSNIEVRVPYLQCTAFLRNNVYGVSDYSTSASPTFVYDPEKHNGTIVVRCVTQLTAPIASSSIQILVSVRSANVEFANPSFYASYARKYSFLAPQSGSEYDDAAEAITIGSPSKTPDHQYLVNFGEQVVSLRPLMKRMNLTHLYDPTTGSLIVGRMYWILHRMPVSYGYATNGLENATAIIGTGTKTFNASHLSPLTWIAPCFIGNRGSVNYSFVAPKRDGSDMIELTVARQSVQSYGNIQQSLISENPSGGSTTFAQAALFSECCAGTTTQIPETNQGLEFQMPNYSMFKFSTCNPLNANSPGLVDHSDLDCFIVSACGEWAVANKTSVKLYSGAGADFNLIFFLNIPVVYQYSSVPPPV